MFSYLFVGNGKFALRFLVVLGEGIQFLDRLALRNRQSKFDIGFRVLVTRLEMLDHVGDSGRRTYVDFCFIGDGSKGLVQCSMHLICRTLEESTTSCRR